MESPEYWMNKSLNIKVPDGLDDLLEEIIRAVLKAQPTHLENFIANHVKKLLEIRESGNLKNFFLNFTRHSRKQFVRNVV